MHEVALVFACLALASYGHSSQTSLQQLPNRRGAEGVHAESKMVSLKVLAGFLLVHTSAEAFNPAALGQPLPAGKSLPARRAAVFSDGRARTSRLRLVAPEDLPEYRAKKAAELAELTESRMKAAAEQTFSAEELAALEEASKSKERVWQGPMANCPQVLKNPMGMGSVDFYGQLRDPSNDPVAETWDAVRTKWPTLGGRSDEELVIALAPIKAIYVDRRSL